MTFTHARLPSLYRLSPMRSTMAFVQGLAPLLIGASLLFNPPLAKAVSLGDIQTSSHIGDVLQLHIPVSGLTEEALNTDCIRLEGPRSDASDDFPWLRAARFRLSPLSDGSQILTISSLQSMQSPVVMVAVRIDCGATLRREYTLLLNPAPVSETVPRITTPAPPRETAPQTSPPSSNNLWRSSAGESVQSIAANLFPHDKSLQSRYRKILRQRNAAKLGMLGDSTVLPLGTELIIPNAQELSNAVTPPSAQSPRAREGITAATPSSKRRSTRVPEQRLILSGSERSGMQMAMGLSGRAEMPEPERDKLRTELQLIATLDEKIATQLELSEKLRQLEALQVQLQSDVAGLESRIRTQQAALPNNLGSTDGSKPAITPQQSTTQIAAKPPVANAKEDTRWESGWLPLGGVAALLLLLLLWRRYRNSDHYAEAVEIAPLEVTDLEPQTDPAEALFEPLTEEDIWPDAATPKRSPSAFTGTDLLGTSELGPPSVLRIHDEAEEHDSAVELAEIMMSFGRVQGAAQTLSDFIRANPKQAVKPWVKLLEVYKVANMRTEFDALTSQLNKTFNVKSVSWDDFDIAMRAPESLEHIEHITKKLCETWGKRECQAYLHGLLRDNRQGTRQGFPMSMVDEILLLMAILESQLGPYRPDAIQEEPPIVTPASRTITTSSTPRPQDTTSSGHSEQRFEMGGTNFDLDLDDQDLTRTLHLNLDDLPDGPPTEPLDIDHKSKPD